ncbi:transporter [Candidatus Saccharibacteria bacterium]|nr:transporter [Candidatus Saccharibacteria bacterium]
MFKKIILASALAAVSSFAAWDLFPVLENHKGQTRFTSNYTTYSDEGEQYHSLNLSLGSRYTIFPDLELALVVPYHVFSYYGGNKLGTDGTGRIRLLTRYQFIPTMNVFADIYFPNEYVRYEDPWCFIFGLQFSRKINQLFNFGSQLATETRTKGDYDDIPLATFAALELDFTVTENFAPYIKTMGNLHLGMFTDHGYQFSHGGGDLYIASNIGVKYDFNETFSIDASAGIGRWVNIDGSPLAIGAALDLLMNF